MAAPAAGAASHPLTWHPRGSLPVWVRFPPSALILSKLESPAVRLLRHGVFTNPVNDACAKLCKTKQLAATCTVRLPHSRCTVNTCSPAQTLIDCQQIRARIDALAQENAWLTAALDIQFKRTTDARARVDLFPPTQSPASLPRNRAQRGRAPTLSRCRYVQIELAH